MRGNSEVTADALRKIMERGDTSTAAKLVRDYKIDMRDLPPYIVDEIERSEKQETFEVNANEEVWEEDWETGEMVLRNQVKDCRK
jgi:hypothetical protein